MELSESSLALLFELWCRERGLELVQYTGQVQDKYRTSYSASGEVVARFGEVVAQ